MPSSCCQILEDLVGLIPATFTRVHDPSDVDDLVRTLYIEVSASLHESADRIKRLNVALFAREQRTDPKVGQHPTT